MLKKTFQKISNVIPLFSVSDLVKKKNDALTIIGISITRDNEIRWLTSMFIIFKKNIHIILKQKRKQTNKQTI